MDYIKGKDIFNNIKNPTYADFTYSPLRTELNGKFNVNTFVRT